MRLLAIAHALEGMTRAEAARLAGMERQALHDAVLRFKAEGPDGRHDRPRPGRSERLSEGQQAALKAHIRRGPRPERDGVSAWRLVDLCEPVAHRSGVRYSLWGLSCLLKRLNLSRQKTRPSHPKALRVPENVTLLPLPSASPAASPALNPVERIWLYLRERYRSHRVLDDYEASLTATCRAWKRLLKEKGRLATLTAYPYLIASEIP